MSLKTPAVTSGVSLTAEEQSVTEKLMRRQRSLSYYPRLMYDITTLEWMKGVNWSSDPTVLDQQDAEARAAIANAWYPTAPECVVCALSVRTFFDCLLRALQLPSGSEVLMSGITIPHVVDVVHHHGLRATSFDIDLVTFTPDIQQCRSAMTGNTRMMIIAPLFGRPMKCVEELLALARERQIITVMDGAQCFSILNIFRAYDADINTVSFGSIKFGTAFGGSISIVKDKALATRIKEIEAALPRRTTREHLHTMTKYLGLLIVDEPKSFGVLRLGAEALGYHVGELVNKASRGFPKDLITSIRHRPHPGMLQLLAYRITHIDYQRRERVCVSAWDILRRLPPYVQVVAAGDPKAPRESTFWLFTLSVADPQTCVKIFQAHSIDAALGTSQMRAVGDASSTPESHELMRHVVYLPVYPEMGEAKRRELVGLFHRMPRKVVQSPSARFHAHVASTPHRHAYQSHEVDALLANRAPFKEQSFHLLWAIGMGPMSLLTAGTALLSRL